MLVLLVAMVVFFVILGFLLGTLLLILWFEADIQLVSEQRGD
jgi:hypothetical protein